jgi:hypothetical protein
MKQFFKVVKQVIEKAKPKPAMALDKDSKFVYQSGADVQKTWRKYGWIPPTEYREDYDFGKNKGVSND